MGRLREILFADGLEGRGPHSRDLKGIGNLNGLRAVRFTVELLRRGAATILRDAPEIVNPREGGRPGSWTRSRKLAGQWPIAWACRGSTVCNALALESRPRICRRRAALALW